MQSALFREYEVNDNEKSDRSSRSIMHPVREIKFVLRSSILQLRSISYDSSSAAGLITARSLIPHVSHAKRELRWQVASRKRGAILRHETPRAFARYLFASESFFIRRLYCPIVALARRAAYTIAIAFAFAFARLRRDGRARNAARRLLRLSRTFVNYAPSAARYCQREPPRRSCSF